MSVLLISILRVNMISSAKAWMVWVLFLFFCLFRAAAAAYGSSQARGQIRAVAAHLYHSHSSVGSKPHLLPIPQLQQRRIINPVRPGIEPASSWILAGFVIAEPQQELLDGSNLTLQTASFVFLACYLTSLCLRFLICKMGIITWARIECFSYRMIAVQKATLGFAQLKFKRYWSLGEEKWWWEVVVSWKILF